MPELKSIAELKLLCDKITLAEHALEAIPHFTGNEICLHNHGYHKAYSLQFQLPTGAYEILKEQATAYFTQMLHESKARMQELYSEQFLQSLNSNV
ncbi:MAG: hypothetical protein ABL951_04130 [Alphaproteobacteria bacterium]